MPDSDVLAPLVQALRDLVAWVEAEEVPAAVIGGVAVAIHGRPRLTKDVDALLLLADERRETFLERGAAFGFSARIPDALGFARRTRVLLVRHAASAIDLDLSFGALPFEEEAIARAERRLVGGVEIPLVRPEDLVTMKAVAHRAKDLADIEGIVASNPKLDRARVRRTVREFARVLEMPEIADDLERMLGAARKRRRR